LSARKKLLITGASGFVGRNLAASPLAESYQLLCPGHAELDLTDTAAVDAYFAAQGPDLVVHCGGKPGHRNAPDHEGLLRDNTRMFHNLARHEEGLERLVVIGSGGVYGAAHYRPKMAEGYFAAHVPADTHGLTQYLCEQHAARSRNIVTLRLFGLFGPGEDYAIRFISNLMCKAVKGLPLTMKQDRLFDYLWIGDLAPVLGWCLAQPPAHKAYNVTPDRAVPLRWLAEQIRALSGKDLPITVREAGLGPEYSGDNARLRRDFPAFSPTPFEKSLPELYRWYSGRADAIATEALLHDK